MLRRGLFRRLQNERLIGAIALGALVLGLVAWLMWPAPDVPAPPRERQYQASTACLLTDGKGLAGDQAKAAWAGMQDASAAELVKVQYLSVLGPQTSANALSFFNSLAMQKCTLIIAMGDVPVAAMMEGKDKFSGIRYFAVGGDTKNSSVSKIDTASADAIRSQVNALIAEAA